MVTGRRKLLLADDSITIQKVVSLTFTDEGMDVATASDGEQAIRLLEENVPDIVLADVFMPGRNGYEVCEHIKGDKRFRHIPVMLLVGAFEPFNEAEARRVGADDVLTKPFQSIRNLVNKVGSLLGGGQQADQNADTLDLAPSLSPPPRDAAASDSASRDAASGQPAHHMPDPAASFADIDMDDALIEATPAERFGQARETSVMERGSSEDDAAARMSHDDDDDEQQIPLVVMRPDSAAEESPAPVNMEDTLSLFDEEQMPEKRQETQPFMSSPEELSPALEPEHAHAARPAFAAHGGVPSDDALLDLDIVEPSNASAVADDDDFILDLTDEISTPTTASASNASAATDVFNLSETSTATDATDIHAAQDFAPVAVEAEAAQVDYAGAFAEAAHGDASDAGDETPTVIAEAPVEATFGEQWAEPAHADASAAHEDASATHDFEISMPPSEFDATEATPEIVEPSDVLYAEGADFAPVQEQAPITEFAPASEEWNIDIGGATESANASATASADSATDSAGASATAFAVEAGRDDSQAPTLQSAPLSNVAGQPLTAEQLSPEIIDAIARRAVEQLSEKVVREIAWEVVPHLAELLIKRRLDEEKSRQQ